MTLLLNFYVIIFLEIFKIKIKKLNDFTKILYKFYKNLDIINKSKFWSIFDILIFFCSI